MGFMQKLLAKVIAVLIALQPWAFGVFAAPRPKSSTASSLSSPKDQIILENTRTSVQVQNAVRESGVVPSSTVLVKFSRYFIISSFFFIPTEAPQPNTQARFSKWNE
jgi:hypothetical protein